MAIHFHNQEINYTLKNKIKYKNWIKIVIQKHKKNLGTINFIFTNDDLLLEKNIQFLNHNTLTDIITFDYSEDNKVNGDVFISLDRVKENAKKFKVNFEIELSRVIIHGVLHLCGLKDKSKLDAKNMRSAENKALKILTNTLG